MNVAACKKFASTLGGTWEPVPWQGANSYTLHNKEKSAILQFRGPNESLHSETSCLAAKIHTDLAPHAKCLGKLPERPSAHEQPLIWIWQMNSLPGDPYLFHADSLTLEKVSTAVVDLAKFFAASWKQPQDNVKIQASRYMPVMEELLAVLPVEYHTTINLVLIHLDDILTLRPVLTHGDLTSGNILMDPETGHLTGVVDWAEATIEPFGIGLWGLDAIIGFFNPKGYSYLHDAKANRYLFRRTFLQEASIGSDDIQHLEWARLLGVLLRYGYTWDSNINQRVPITANKDLKYLKLCIQGSVFDDTVAMK